MSPDALPLPARSKSQPNDPDSFICKMGDLARKRLDGKLPDGFILFQQKNGKWVGRHPRGEVKALEREWVESMLFLAATDRQP